MRNSRARRRGLRSGAPSHWPGSTAALFLPRPGSRSRRIRPRTCRTPAGGLATVSTCHGAADMTSPSKLHRSVRSGLAPAAKALLFKSGALDVLRKVRPSDGLAILRYHAICGPEGYAYASPGICISPEGFDAHVAYLAANYNVLPLPEAVAALREHRVLPPNAVAITFDDGYADNLESARALARHRLSATFYITAGCLADGQPFWPSELRYLIRALPDGRTTLEAAGRTITLDLTSDQARDQAVGVLTKTFKAHPVAVREDLRTQLRARAGQVQLPRIMLTWDEVREMHALGMTIGSHTVTHPN